MTTVPMCDLFLSFPFMATMVLYKQSFLVSKNQQTLLLLFQQRLDKCEKTSEVKQGISPAHYKKRTVTKLGIYMVHPKKK